GRTSFARAHHREIDQRDLEHARLWWPQREPPGVDRLGVHPEGDRPDGRVTQGYDDGGCPGEGAPKAGAPEIWRGNRPWRSIVADTLSADVGGMIFAGY